MPNRQSKIKILHKGYARYKSQTAKINLKNAKTYIAQNQNGKANLMQKKEIINQWRKSKKGIWLAPLEKFNLNLKDKKRKPILKITTEHYLELLDFTGREYHKDKPGIISGNIAPILLAMGLSQKQWFDNLKNYNKWYYRVLGPLFALKDKLLSVKQNWFKGTKTWENPPTEATATT